MKQKILFMGGPIHQTKILHKISEHLDKDYDCFFTPFYVDGFVDVLATSTGLLDDSALSGRRRDEALKYIKKNSLKIDLRGEKNDYDLAVIWTDLFVIPENIQDIRLVLVQEGITEPETWAYHMVKNLNLPLYLANSATTGLSDVYDVFCVGSDGFRDHFIRKGVNPEKIAVTGIPCLDNFAKFKKNDFPYHDYVLVATTPYRETLRIEDRKGFLRKCLEIAGDRQMIVKTHPAEHEKRARKEVKEVCPNALFFSEGSVDEMIANAAVVITQISTCTFTALALGKETHTYLDIDELNRLMPIQNGGKSAKNVADVCRRVIKTPLSELRKNKEEFDLRTFWEKPLNTYKK